MLSSTPGQISYPKNLSIDGNYLSYDLFCGAYASRLENPLGGIKGSYVAIPNVSIEILSKSALTRHYCHLERNAEGGGWSYVDTTDTVYDDSGVLYNPSFNCGCATATWYQSTAEPDVGVLFNNVVAGCTYCGGLMMLSQSYSLECKNENGGSYPVFDTSRRTRLELFEFEVSFEKKDLFQCDCGVSARAMLSELGISFPNAVGTMSYFWIGGDGVVMSNYLYPKAIKGVGKNTVSYNWKRDIEESGD